MKYDLMIIGAGPAGYTLAASAAAAGLSVLVFEKSKLGGTCLNRGCIPTKTYLAITDLLPSCKKFLDAGLKYEDLSFDLAALLKYKDDVVTRLQTQIEALFKAHKVEVIAAEAKLISGHEIEASGQVYKGERIVIAAGGKPTVPAVFAEAYKNSKRIVTSDELLDLEAGDYFKSEMKRVAIIGGGIIGVEFAQIFSNLGAEVSLFEAMPRLLMRMDSDISKTLERNFKLAKIKVEKNVQVLDLLDEGEEVQIHYQKQKANATVETKAFDLVLIAIGRRSEVESVLGENLELETDAGQVLCNQNFQSSIDSVYAIGDIRHGSQGLAHSAEAEAAIFLAELLGKKQEIELMATPSAVYCQPEIATVGLSEEAAKSIDPDACAVQASTISNGKSLLERSERGFIKLIYSQSSRRFLGASLYCMRASDLISELALALSRKLSIDELKANIRPHPSYSELISEALHQVPWPEA